MLQDKVILITGGAAGIGWACAMAYASAGATVCIADRTPLEEDRLRQLPGEKHLYISCDVGEEADVRVALDVIMQRFGRLDAIHNNAGVVHPSKPLHETTNEEWDTLWRVNLDAILYTTRYGLGPLKASRGSILHTSSLVGTIGQESHAAYVATKAAIHGLTKAMALDYAPLGIRVNAVAPGAVRTDALTAWSLEQPNKDAIAEYLDRLQPLGSLPDGSVIADACVFLLSHAARFVTGCILPVTGGAELGYRTSL